MLNKRFSNCLPNKNRNFPITAKHIQQNRGVCRRRKPAAVIAAGFWNLFRAVSGAGVYILVERCVCGPPDVRWARGRAAAHSSALHSGRIPPTKARLRVFRRRCRASVGRLPRLPAQIRPSRINWLRRFWSRIWSRSFFGMPLSKIDGRERAMSSRENPGHLRQVVRTERESLRRPLGDLVPAVTHGGARNLDHRTDHVVDLVVALREYLLGHSVDDVLLVAQLPCGCPPAAP